MTQIVLFQPSNGYIMDKLDIFPPLALIYLSTKLHKKYSITIIDERIDGDWKNTLRDCLNEDTICVGATSMTGMNLKFVKKFFEEVKLIRPDVKTVMGGIHVTSTPEDSIHEPFLDFIVMGDGETVFYNLVESLKKSQSIETIKGICYKTGGGTVIINQSENFEDMRELVPSDIPFHLIDIEKYVTIEDGRRKFVVFTSRGCPFGCTFCHNSNRFNKGRWRGMTSENMFKLVKLMKEKYDITYFVFQDDSFWVDNKRVDDFVSLLEESGVGIKWALHGVTMSCIKYITPEHAKRLKKSGLERIICGIETVSPNLKCVIKNKFMPAHEILEIDKILSEAGIKMIYSFMSGFPNETNEDVKMNIETMFKIKEQSARSDVGNIKPVIYYPGTELYNQAIENGFNPPHSFEEWSKYSWNNYEDLNYTWLDGRRKKFLQDIYFSTLLLQSDYVYINSKIWRHLSSMLAPIFRWRVKHLFFRFSPTLWLFRLIKKFDLI